ncbi:hypothetical protein P152DRAFT_505559 [Eremomyces bilateralis CBS 781.70]|uniref:Hydantoin racemase n=1 Tax=Eremomyces bilateralis CBS 781.70 TaxID=1392243 RepID=A0A6G1GCD7_9PEZI|nr:uncharacterized protein P152DRAFT_505559 [Eremomyces bilateralis CBS 781.70]KAF1815755.1 hypothetical protein P152DRAFT_505559 [Eremomyces bilateralis CBS 781.70]
MASRKSILIINPNSTQSMTDGLKPLVDSLHFHNTTYTYFTAPSGPPSINSATDTTASAQHCLPSLLHLLPHHDGFLIACYSAHPLVALLQAHETVRAGKKMVTGIFEASVATSLQCLAPGERFGIVSTGQAWEAMLSEAVRDFLGAETSARFAGVETTGLTAVELHDVGAEVVGERMREAVGRLVRRGEIGAVCLGCAGMAGMNEMVRGALVGELGGEKGGRVKIVDGVQAGVAWLEGAIRMEF